MIDSELKDINYYYEHDDEAVKKFFACRKFNEIDPKTGEFKIKMDVDDINKKNCKNALIIVILKGLVSKKELEHR